MASHQTHDLVVVVGATAVGKTELCLQLATNLKTEIISADSRQFFREMNIGTAKPTTEELALVKHHFINSHSIVEDYSVGQYEQEALALLEKLFEQQSVLILTGGSGLYVQAVCEGLDSFPEISPHIRQELIAQFEQEGLENLSAQLKKLDAEYYEKVDKQNPQRIIRALEVCLGTGKPFSFFRKGNKQPRNFQLLKIGLERPRNELYQRIEARMDKMLNEGLIEEAKTLLPFREKNALQTVGYQEVFGYLEQQYGYAEMVRLLKRNSRRYAKRQMTWFKKDADIHWFEAEKTEEILTFILNNISSR